MLEPLKSHSVEIDIFTDGRGPSYAYLGVFQLISAVPLCRRAIPAFDFGIHKGGQVNFLIIKLNYTKGVKSIFLLSNLITPVPYFDL